MRFRRKSAEDAEPTPEESGEVEASDDETTPAEAADDSRTGGPFDDSEIEDVDDREGIDLGSLLLAPAAPVEVRLSVDEASGQVQAALLVGEDGGAVELRAFAASRGSSGWADLRPLIVAETERLGGSVSEQDGPFGPELHCDVTVPTPDGGHAHQVSRVLGFDGPRWLLRATLVGPPAVAETVPEDWEQTIRQTVVRRGREAMAPGTPLPLRLPPDARRVEQ